MQSRYGVGEEVLSKVGSESAVVVSTVFGIEGVEDLGHLRVDVGCCFWG